MSSNEQKGHPQCFLLGVVFARLKMQKTIQKDTRWREREREREGERRDTKDCIFNGKSKEKNRRELSGEEGETKQGAEKMALFFIYPLSLVSPFPLSFRKEQNKRKNYEKEKGKERNRRDRPRGGI